MAFNRFMARTPMQFDFFKAPLDVLSQALQVKQQTYDRNAALADQLLSTSISSLDADRPRANAIIRGYQQSIDDMVENYDGDYSKMSKELLGLARNVRKDFTSGGEAFSIEYNKGLYDKWLDFSQKAALSGRGPSVEQVNLGNQYILNNYKGAQYNKDTGTFSSLETPQLVEFQEMGDLVDHYAQQVVAEKQASGKWKVDMGQKIWEKTSSGWQQVTEDRIAAAVMDGLAGHQGWQAYSEQMAMFGKPITADDYQAQVRRAMNTFAYRWSESDHQIMVNPFAEAEAKKKAKEEEARPDMIGVLGAMRENAIKLPTQYDATEVIIGTTPATTPEQNAANRIMYSIGGLDPGIANYSPDIKRTYSTFDSYITSEGAVNKYGNLGQNLYNSVKNSSEFTKLSEQEKQSFFKEKYDKAVIESNRTQDYILKMNDAAMKELQNMYLDPNTIRSSKITIVERDSGKTSPDLTWSELDEAIDVKGIDWMKSDKQELKQIAKEMLDGKISGIVTPASGLNFGLELAMSGTVGSRYRVIMHGYDAKAEAIGENLMQLYEPMYGQKPESPWVYTKGFGAYAIKTTYQPQFDKEGNFIKTEPQVWVRSIKTDPNYPEVPLYSADGSIQFDSDPQLTGLTLKQIMEQEYKANMLGYQTIKAADTKH